MLLKKQKLLFSALFILCAALIPHVLKGQTTIEECYALAEKNYPLIKKYSLIDRSMEYSIANANKGYIPQVSLGAKATYQSEVVSFPDNLPISLPQLHKDQYNAAININQVIWDGGVISGNKKVIKANYEVEKNSVEKDMYSIKERINNLFFGILLTQQQITLTEIFNTELEVNFRNIESYIVGGIANNADLDIVKVEQIKNIQRRGELESTQNSYIQMLSYLTGKEIKNLSSPTPDDLFINSSEIKRPEIQLFESQLTMLDTQKLGVKSTVMPKFSLFVEGGYGRPALNMLSSGFNTYAIGGIKLTWNFSSFYTKGNELKIINTNKNSVENQKDIFLFNTKLDAIQDSGEIEKIKMLIKNDNQIIELKENIIKSAQAKASNGAISVNELQKEINSLMEARQNKILHNIQLMMAIYNLKYTLNQ